MIEFVVTLYPPEPVPGEKKNLEQLLYRYIENFVKDLAIPIKVTLLLKFSASENVANLPFQVSINGKKCRMPLSGNAWNEKEYKKLASQIMEVIHSNGALLISRAVLQSIMEEYIQGTNTSLKNLSYSHLHQLMLDLIKRGFKIDRCKDFTPPSSSKGWTYLHYYEALIQDVKAVNVKVTFNEAYETINRSNKQSSKDSLHDMSTLMQEGLFYELGIVFPKIQWEMNESFENNEFQFQINDVNYPSIFGLKPGEYLVNDTVDRLTLLQVKGKKAINPANSLECAIIEELDLKTCESSGLTTWDPLGYLILHLSHQLRKRAGSFLTKDMVENNLNTLRSAFPVLVDTCLKQYDMFLITGILRGLVDEEISIRDLRNILENLLYINGTTHVDLSKNIVFFPEGTHLVYSSRKKNESLTVIDYTNYIRSEALKRYISYKYTKGSSTLIVYLLDPAIEDRIKDLGEKKLPKTERDELIEAIYREIGNLPSTVQNPTILTSYEIRHRFRELTQIEFPHLVVLCYQELSPEMNIQPIAKISLN